MVSAVLWRTLQSGALDTPSALRRRAVRLGRVLRLCKWLHAGAVRWYPYPTVANFFMIERLLQRRPELLPHLLRGPLADFGCGDGDAALILERSGVAVDAFDLPSTNFNQMEGVRTLVKLLGAGVQVRELDLTRPFTLDRHYSLVLLLGLLYHLENPLQVLMALLPHAEYLVLSTRIFRYAPGSTADLGALPVAYLVGADELNADATNYWIFTEAGLRRLVDRAGWDLLEVELTGDTEQADPTRPDHDLRAFCLLRSRELV